MRPLTARLGRAPQPADSQPAAPKARIAAATRASHTAFAGLGVIAASWSSRIPQVKAGLGLSPSILGLVLLSAALGSMLALPLAGGIVMRFGAGRAVRVAATVAVVFAAAAGVCARVGVLETVACLMCFGLASGVWDVSMNVHAAAVERLAGTAIMSRFHASFSVGMVAGALGGAAMNALRVPVAPHLVAAAVIVGVAVRAATARFVAVGGREDGRAAAAAPDAPEARDGAGTRPSARAATAWRSRRTLVIGAVVAGFALTEGTGNDWIGVGLVGGHHARAAVATLAYAAFLAAMTTVRWYGPQLVGRFGRVTVLRVSIAAAIAGVLAFAFGPSLAVAFAGVVPWGIGAALGFPLGISAASDEPASAAARVSVVASIGYLGLLGGPPMIGLLARFGGVSRALAIVALFLLAAGAGLDAMRPPAQRSGGCVESP